MRKDRLTQKQAEQSGSTKAKGVKSGWPFFGVLSPAAPRDFLVLGGIVAAFALFAAYDYARVSQQAAENRALRTELATLKGALAGVTPSEGEAVFSIASEPSDQLAKSNASEPIKNTSPTGTPPAQIAPHFLVLGGVMLVVLLLTWQRRERPKPMAPQLVETREPDGVFDALNFAVAHWAPDGRLLGCNARFRNLFGSDASIICADVQHGAVMKSLTDDAHINLVQDDEYRRIVEIGCANGSAYLMEERPLKNGGFVSLISDNSAAKGAAQALDDLREEQRLMAQQLREEKFRAEAASRAKTSFLAHLSHDVRTPLNHIIGFADMIAHQTYGPIGDKRYLNYVNDIKGSGEKLLSSFSEILELAQIEGGQLVLRRERLGVEDVLTTTANRFQDAAKRAGLSFETSIPDSGLLYGDRFCIERMVGNLVDNAIQFTPNGGSVRLAAYLADDGVVIEVSDTGIGMSQERLKDLAQPFVLGDAAFTRETSGVGLGIAISRAIAELSGGVMEIDSNPAIGTTVAISLPLHAANADGVQAA